MQQKKTNKNQSFGIYLKCYFVFLIILGFHTIKFVHI